VIESLNGVPISVQYTVTQDANCYYDAPDRCITYFDLYGGLGFGTTGSPSTVPTQKPNYAVLNIIPTWGTFSDFMVEEGGNTGTQTLIVEDLKRDPNLPGDPGLLSHARIKDVDYYEGSPEGWLTIDGNPIGETQATSYKTPTNGTINFSIGVKSSTLPVGRYKVRFTLEAKQPNGAQIYNSPVCDFNVTLWVNPRGGGGC